VERVALDCRIATEASDVAATLLWRVKAALAKLGKRGVVNGEAGRRGGLWPRSQSVVVQFANCTTTDMWASLTDSGFLGAMGPASPALGERPCASRRRYRV